MILTTKSFELPIKFANDCHVLCFAFSQSKGSKHQHKTKEFSPDGKCQYYCCVFGEGIAVVESLLYKGWLLLQSALDITGYNTGHVVGLGAQFSAPATN